MKTKLFSILILLALAFGALAPVTTAQAKAEAPSDASEAVSPAGMLNPDGTLNLEQGFSGALDLDGYSVEIDPVRGPVFSAEGSGEANPQAAVTPGNWAALGDGGGILNERVLDIAVSGSNVYMVGSFTDAGNIPEADFVAKWDGANWSALGSNGAGNGAISYYTSTLAVSGTNVYVGGSFFYVNNNGTRLNTAGKIAKWDTLTENWSALGSNGADGAALNNTVAKIAVDGSGNVYAGGEFTDVNNNGTVLGAADYIAKFDGTNWSALGSNGADNGSFGTGTYIETLAINGADLYVGGLFTNVNNNGTVLGAADYLAKWDGINWSAVGSNGAGNGAIGSTVNTLAISGANIYVGGSFTNVNNNGTVLGAADYVAKFDGANWSALGSNGAGNGSLGGTVYALVVDGTDVYVSGSFKNVNDNGSVLGAADYVAKWDGANWSAIGDNGAGDGSIPNKPDPYVPILAMQGSSLLVGGIFYDVNNGGTVLPQADFLAQWDGSNWSSVGSDSNGALVNGYLGSLVYTIAVIDTDVYVGGIFTNVSNHGYNLPEADYIAKWDGTDWSGLGSNGAGDGSLSYYVYALAVDESGNLYVGGGFSNVNNKGTSLPAADYIAKWDGTNWSALGSNGAGNGSLPSAGAVYALAFNGTDLYVGGLFTDVNNGGTLIPEADKVAKWDGINWSALGSNGAGNGSLSGGVFALAANGTNIYAAGNFTDVNNNGTSLTAADYVARWDTLTGNWSALGSNGAGGGSLDQMVRSVAVDTSGNLYVGGGFTNVNNGGSILTAADYIAKWDGANWSALGSNGAGNDGSLPNGGVSTILVNGANIYVGGGFINVVNNGVVLTAADKVAKWDGTNWSALGSNGAGDGSIRTNDSVTALTTMGTDLLVGGQFSNVNNNGTVLKEADYLAAYGMVSGPPDTTPPTVVSVTRLDPSPSSAASVRFLVTFSEVIGSVNVDDLPLSVSGGLNAHITAIDGINSTRTVTVTLDGGSGTLKLNVADDDSIIDASGNPLGGSGPDNGAFTGGETYAVTDTTAPTVVSITRLDPSPNSADTVRYAVTFSEVVLGFADNDFTLTTSGISGASAHITQIAGWHYVIAVDTGSGSGTLRLVIPIGASITDTVGNPLAGLPYLTGEEYTINQVFDLFLPLVLR